MTERRPRFALVSSSPWRSPPPQLAAGIAALLDQHLRSASRRRRTLPAARRVDEETTDPAPWGMNWPRQFDGYQRTVDTTRTRYGGSDGALPRSRGSRRTRG